MTGPDEHGRDLAVEETLRRTLEHAADRAPALPAAVATRLAAPGRRRGPRTQALLAAAAVVVVAAGVTAGVTTGFGGPAEPAPAVAPTSSARVATPQPTVNAQAPEPIEDVWPQALRKVAATTPGGEKLRPEQFLDDDTLLVSTWSSFEKTSALYAYDLGTRKLRTITNVPTPKGTVLFAADFHARGDRIVWWSQLKSGTTQIWSVPLSGGDAELVTTLRGGRQGLDGLEIVGDRIVFSSRSGGVHTAPLAGGPATPLDGGASMHLLAWPWIGEPGPFGPADEPRFARIRNVETGETRTAVVRDGEEMSACSVARCSGHRQGAYFRRLRDGSGEQPLPGHFSRMGSLAQDRFHVTALADGSRFIAVTLTDLTDGRSADLGIKARKNTEGGFAVSPPAIAGDGRLVSYTIKDTLHVIDLSKI